MALSSPFRRRISKLHPESIPSFGAVLYNAISRTRVFQAHYEMMARDLLASCSQGSVLDVGTGPAWLLIAIHRLASELRLVGIDVSPSMVSGARRNLAAAGLAGSILVKEGQAQELPFPDEFFSVVVSTGSMHHWKDPIAGLNEAYRVLKTGGHGLMYDIVRDTPSSVLAQVVRDFGYLRTALFWIHSFEEPFYSRDEIEALARSSLFKKSRTRFIGGIYCLDLIKESTA